jgi:hypothetical protein
MRTMYQFYSGLSTGFLDFFLVVLFCDDPLYPFNAIIITYWRAYVNRGNKISLRVQSLSLNWSGV